MPGPAAYGRGGQQLTTTDANLLLGRIDPAHQKPVATLEPGLEFIAGQIADLLSDHIAAMLAHGVAHHVGMLTDGTGDRRLVDEGKQHEGDGGSERRPDADERETQDPEHGAPCLKLLQYEPPL